MTHLTEEDLIDQFYGEGDTQTAEQHLAQCASCSKAYAALQADLAEMQFAPSPHRGLPYGQKVWASISASLAAYPPPKRKWLADPVWRGLSFAAACILLVACTFLGGRVWERRQALRTAQVKPAPKQQLIAPVTPKARVVVVVLSDHLDRSERLLVQLKHADAERTETASPLRDEARSLLVANRICRQNARHHDDPELTTALDRLDHLLEELASQPGGLNQATLTRLQNEINSDSLLFEVRVLRSRLPAQPAAETNHAKGGTI